MAESFKTTELSVVSIGSLPSQASYVGGSGPAVWADRTDESQYMEIVTDGSSWIVPWTLAPHSLTGSLWSVRVTFWAWATNSFSIAVRHPGDTLPDFVAYNSSQGYNFLDVDLSSFWLSPYYQYDGVPAFEAGAMGSALASGAAFTFQQYENPSDFLDTDAFPTSGKTVRIFGVKVYVDEWVE